jgi:hypothetical protein
MRIRLWLDAQKGWLIVEDRLFLEGIILLVGSWRFHRYRLIERLLAPAHLNVLELVEALLWHVTADARRLLQGA